MSTSEKPRIDFRVLLAGLIAAVLAGQSLAAAQQRVNPDAKTIADFQARVQEYVALHRKLERTLPTLPKEATPEQIDQHQRGLGKLLQGARATAKPGDLFTPDMQRRVRELLAQVLDGPHGRQIKASILDEYTADVRIAVNGRYPDTVPLSTVPAQVLQNLPALPEDLEYRFVGTRMILLDSHAHIIADYVDRAFR